MTKFRRYDKEMSRRRFVTVAMGGTATAGILSLLPVLGAARPVYRLTPARLPAIGGDILVHAASDRLGEPVTVDDLSETPIRAWPAREDPEAGELVVKSEEPNNLLVVMRFADGGGEAQGVVALSAICTHLGCQVNDNAAQQPGTLLCPCHSGLYQANTGERISGPQPRALPELSLAVGDGGAINVTGAFAEPPYGTTEGDWNTLVREAEQA